MLHYISLRYTVTGRAAVEPSAPGYDSRESCTTAAAKYVDGDQRRGLSDYTQLNNACFELPWTRISEQEQM